jgi:starvation-inducible DNA-binding protein
LFSHPTLSFRHRAGIAPLSFSGDPVSTKVKNLEPRKPPAQLDTPSDLANDGVRDIAQAINGILADAFALYLKTKNFHWHISGPHFRDYHLMLDEQATQIFASTDDMAERVRKIGGVTLRSIGDIARRQSIEDNDEDFVAPLDMLRELTADNKSITEAMRKAHKLCDDKNDVATASMLEVWIDETERRTWFLFEATREVQKIGR